MKENDEILKKGDFKATLVDIEPGDTCVFHIAISFKREHFYCKVDFENFLTTKIKEYFED